MPKPQTTPVNYTPTYPSATIPMGRTMHIPSMLDVRTPAGARFTNPNLNNHFSVEFKNSANSIEKDLYATLHYAEIYAPYYDANGNIHLILVDYYDFDKMSGDNLFVLINNNAYVQQELGMLKNYAAISFFEVFVP